MAGWQDPDVRRWTKPPDRVDEAGARRWIAGCATRRARWLSLDLVIRDPQTDRSLGEVGLSSFSMERTVEIGYWLLPAGRGRGLASSAVRLLTNWVVTVMPAVQPVASTHPDNVESERVIEAAGYRLERSDPSGERWWRLADC